MVQAAPRSGATDLLRLVPGLVASQHSGEGKAQQLFLRGFDAVHGQDVELLVAGLPVNEVSHVHALGYADLNWLIPDAVREVRVTEGSYRAFQGDFAVAGTVQYELGLEEPGLTAAASYGSFNRLRLFAGVRPTDAPETFAAVEYVQGDGFGPQRAFGRVSLLGQAVLKVGPARLRAVLGSAGSRFDSPGVVRQDALEAGAGFYDAFGLRQGGSTSRHQLLLGAELPHETGRTTLEVYGVLSDLRLENNFTGHLQHPEGDGLEQQQSDGLFGARAHHRRHFHALGSLVTLELGLGGRRDAIHQSQRGYREADGSPYRDDFSAAITQTAVNAWTEVAWQPGRWRFMLGGRLDVLHYEVKDELAFDGQGATRSAFGPHWGLKAGVERALGEAWRLFLNYGDGFRSPQARSLSDGERAPFVHVRGAELGASFVTPKVDVRGALFGSYVANDVFFDHTVGTTVYLGSTLRGGAQATVSARPVEGLVLAGSLTGATAHVVDSDSLLPYFAPLVGRLDASYARPFSWLGLSWTPSVGTGLTLIGPRPLPYDEFSYAVFLWDVRAALQVGRVELTLDVQNLLGARWRDGEFVFPSYWDPPAQPSLLPARHFTAGTPRQFSLTLEVHL
ncbi:MAG: TonB-dependent receptor [Myxococcota bacterium]